eukprot:15471265-Alexandrium_andersonii.AAC.1
MGPDHQRLLWFLDQQELGAPPRSHQPHDSKACKPSAGRRARGPRSGSQATPTISWPDHRHTPRGPECPAHPDRPRKLEWATQASPP